MCVCVILIPKVVFGDLPVNPIFWLCISYIEPPQFSPL